MISGDAEFSRSLSEPGSLGPEYCEVHVGVNAKSPSHACA